MTTYEVNIICNGKDGRGICICETSEPRSSAEEAEKDLIDELKADGWLFEGDKAYCPECRRNRK